MELEEELDGVFTVKKTVLETWFVQLSLVVTFSSWVPSDRLWRIVFAEVTNHFSSSKPSPTPTRETLAFPSKL